MIKTTGTPVSTPRSKQRNAVIAPCPSWCSEQGGHPFDELGRLHVARRGHVMLCSFESPDGTREPASIDVDYEAEGLGIEAARQLASDAAALAAILEQAA